MGTLPRELLIELSRYLLFPEVLEFLKVFPLSIEVYAKRLGIPVSMFLSRCRSTNYNQYYLQRRIDAIDWHKLHEYLREYPRDYDLCYAVIFRDGMFKWDDLLREYIIRGDDEMVMYAYRIWPNYEWGAETNYMFIRQRYDLLDFIIPKVTLTVVQWVNLICLTEGREDKLLHVMKWEIPDEAWKLVVRDEEDGNFNVPHGTYRDAYLLYKVSH